MKKIELIPCGTKVTPKLLKVDAMITCSSIRFDKVTYELTYFNSGEQKTIWMNENEFNITGPVDKVKVGFKK